MISKVEIGQRVFWVHADTRYGKKVPCPMCFGKRSVVLILGDGSQTDVECGFCSHGYEGPSGFAQSWEPISEIRSGAVTGISTRDGTKYELGYNGTFIAHDLFETEAEAEVEQAKKFKEVNEAARAHFEDSFKRCTKKQVWSAGYHKNCIKDLEKNIEWHRCRLSKIEQREASA